MNSDSDGVHGWPLVSRWLCSATSLPRVRMVCCGASCGSVVCGLETDFGRGKSPVIVLHIDKKTC